METSPDPRSHTIRLRGPWSCRLRPTESANSDPATESQRIQMPDGLASMIPVGFHGSVVLTRSFHRPSGLDDSVIVEVVGDCLYPARVWLNTEELQPVPQKRFRHTITAMLQLRNELEVQLVIDAPGPMDQPMCEVWLCILPRQPE